VARVAAMDVGNESIKVVALASRAGMPELLGVLHEPLDELARLEDGPERSAACRARVSKLMAVSRLPTGEVVTPVSGRGTIARYVQVPPVPPWRLEALMRFEAMQQAGGAVEDPAAESRSYDYRMLDVPDVEGQTLLLLAISQEATVLERTELARASGCDDPDIDLAAIGLFNAYVLGHGPEDDRPPLDAGTSAGKDQADKPEGAAPGPAEPKAADESGAVVLLDIGADELNLCIVRNGGLYFVRHQPGGGRAFTEAVKQAFWVSWAEAEEFKRSRGRIYADPGEAPSEKEQLASEALSRQAADLARSVEAALMYARAQTKTKALSIEKILLSGGGARLEGLAEFLARRLRTDVEPLQPLRKVSLGGLSSNAMAPLEGEYSTFAIPIGLALARVTEGGAILDLRTRENKTRRDFRQKGLFAWAAAFVFALGFVFWIAGAIRHHSICKANSLSAAEIVASDDTALAALETVRAKNRRLEAEMDALRERVTSGEDLLRVLSQLKRRTPKSIRLVSVSTSRPGSLGGEAARDDRTTFQKGRRVYLRGYARSRDSYPHAYNIVTSYERKLGELEDLFAQVSQRVAQRTGDADDGGPRIVEFILEVEIARRR